MIDKSKRKGKGNQGGIPLRTATNLIYNRISDNPIFEENNFQEDLKECIKNVLTAMTTGNRELPSSEDELVRQFLIQWNNTYSEYQITNLEGSKGGTQEEGTEQQDTKSIQLFIEQNNLSIPSTIVPVFARHYQTILGWLERGAVCVRWKRLEDPQRRIVKIRLLEGLCVIVDHLCLMHVLEEPEQLEQWLQKSTIIIHGSYLFGAQDYRPADMDVIIVGDCSCSSAPLPGKLARETRDDKMTIGHQCSLIDIMVGIPLCTQRLLTNVSPEALREEILSDLGGYLNAIGSSNDLGKEYRKLVNCALVIQYLLEQSGQSTNTDLQSIIEQANRAIIGTAPRVNTNTLQNSLQVCKKALSQLKKTFS